MKVLASYNMKGGVGKTTSVVNLAHLCASHGCRTLLWDLDPQGAATFHFGQPPLQEAKLKKLLKDKDKLDSCVQPSGYENLDILPAGFEYRHMDVVLGDGKKSHKRLRKLFASFEDAYDFFFLDCPPSISTLSEGIFNAADVILMPVIPTVLSQQTYLQVKQYIDEVVEGNIDLIAFFSMVDKRKQLHRDLVAASRHNPDFCRSGIPNRSIIERMGVEQKPVTAFAKDSQVIGAYQMLWMEIVDRIQACPEGEAPSCLAK